MIEPTAMFPVLVTQKLEELKDFYVQNFGFQAVFYDAEFYLHLLHPNSGIQLGFLLPDLPSQPGFLFPTAGKEGMVISLEVLDAQLALESASQLGLEIAMPYKEEPWGQKHFMVRDPAGFVVDIVEHVEQ